MKRIVVLSLLLLLMALPGSARAENLVTTDENHAFDPDERISEFVLSSLREKPCCQDSSQTLMAASHDEFDPHVGMEAYARKLARSHHNEFGDWVDLYRDTSEDGSARIKTRYFLQSRIDFWRNSESALILDIDGTRPSRIILLSYKF